MKKYLVGMLKKYLGWGVWRTFLFDRVTRSMGGPGDRSAGLAGSGLPLELCAPYRPVV